MATAPFPFFYSPTYAYATFPSVADPAYLPHSVSPAPPIVAGPPSYISPSAATYPPPPFPGGYSTSTYSAPPAFPYPPPASAYTPAPGPPNWPTWPPLAPDPTPPILSQPPLARNPSILNQSTPSMATSPIYTSACAPVTSAEGSSATAADLGFNLVDTKPQRHSQVSNTATNQQYSPAFAPALLESAEAQARAEAAISNNMPRAVRDLKHRMDEHHAQFQRSVASLQGQLSKLRDRLSSLTTSSVALSTSSSSPFGASFVASTPKFASLSATKSSTKPSATAYVAPQVFDEMQTPSSSQGTHGSAPDYRSGHHTPIQGTCLRDGNSNLREQNVEGMPQAYALHNLICRTVFLGDGTERRYYALPEDYPLKSSSVVEKVSVTAPVAEQAVGLAPILCSKANNIAVSESLDVHDVQPPIVVQDDHIGLKEMHVSEEEKQQQDFENALINVQYLRAPQLNVLLIHERRKEWHPGASAPVHSSNAEPPRELGYVAMLVPKALHLCNQVGTYVQQPSDSGWIMLVIHEEEKEWDLGEKTVMSSTLSIEIAGVLQTSVWTTSGIFIVPYVLTATIQFGVSTFVPKQRCHCRVSSSHENYEVQFLWDPGILNQLGMLLDKSAVPKLVSRVQTTLKLGQPVDWKRFSAQVSLLSLSHSWCNTPTVFFLVHCLPMVLDWPYAETVQQLACYSRMSSSTQEEKDAAAMYQVLRIQLPMRTTTHIWDPGIEPILFLYKELQISNWTSMASNGITSYAFTMDLINDQWEFVYQQSVQMNYIARNLLSSHNYLQILEMDIIFITFLPP